LPQPPALQTELQSVTLETHVAPAWQKYPPGLVRVVKVKLPFWTRSTLAQVASPKRQTIEKAKTAKWRWNSGHPSTRDPILTVITLVALMGEFIP
jgi:hypothetical protein